MRSRGQAGFSLIELTMVMAIILIASVPILGQFSQVAGSTMINEDIQTASQLAQERAEQILALRRDQGFASIVTGTTTENLTGEFDRYSRSVAINTTSSPVSCPAGAECKSVQVTVSLGLINRADVFFSLVEY